MQWRESRWMMWREFDDSGCINFAAQMHWYKWMLQCEIPWMWQCERATGQPLHTSWGGENVLQYHKALGIVLDKAPLHTLAQSVACSGPFKGPRYLFLSLLRTRGCLVYIWYDFTQKNAKHKDLACLVETDVNIECNYYWKKCKQSWKNLQIQYKRPAWCNDLQSTEVSWNLIKI